MNTIVKKIIFIGTGAVIGGVAGYLVGELVADQVLKKEIEKYLPHEDKPEKVVKPVEKKFVERKDYTNFSKSSIDLEKLAAPYKSNDNGSPKPTIISEEDYNEAPPGYKVQIISYYEEDTTFSNEQEEILDDVRFLGENIHLHFGELSNDPDCVYVKDEARMMLYEVIRIKGSYSNLILGEPVKPNKPKRGKKVKNEQQEEDGE